MCTPSLRRRVDGLQEIDDRRGAEPRFFDAEVLGVGFAERGADELGALEDRAVEPAVSATAREALGSLGSGGFGPNLSCLRFPGKYRYYLELTRALIWPQARRIGRRRSS